MRIITNWQDDCYLSYLNKKFNYSSEFEIWEQHSYGWWSRLLFFPVSMATEFGHHNGVFAWLGITHRVHEVPSAELRPKDNLTLRNHLFMVFPIIL